MLSQNENGHCVWCGKQFEHRYNVLYCNAACKQAYWRWKHRLNLLHAQASQAIDEIEAYLEYPQKQKEAENVLGQLADRLHALGFEHDVEQLPLPAEAYTLENSIGENAL